MGECASTDIAKFNKHEMIALEKEYYNATFNTTTNTTTPGFTQWKAWFNGQAYHTPAEAFAFATNVILNTYADASADTPVQITTVNHPLPRSSDEKLVSGSGQSLGFAVAIMILFGMAFLVSFFVIFPVTERASKAKHMQLLSGVNLGVQWDCVV